jgi:hypothetical protein
LLRAALLIALFTFAALAAPAAAAPVPNACKYGFDGYWRSLTLNTSGSAAPNPVAPGGAIALTGASLHADMPRWIPEYGYNLGLLDEGRNEIPTRIWIAVAGGNTAEGVQVRELSTTAVTTITVRPDGTPDPTPLSATVPIPDTAWTASASEGVAGFAQAGPGALPELPVGRDGSPAKPLGSIYISAQLKNGLRFDLDCQPGSSASEGPGSETFAPGIAAPFAAAGIGKAAKQPKDPHARRPAAIRSARLTRRPQGRRVTVAIACRTTARCAGGVRLATAGRVKAGKRRRVLALASRRFIAPPRGTSTVRLTLTRAAVRWLDGRRKTAVRLTVTPAKGAAVSKRLLLRAR